VSSLEAHAGGVHVRRGSRVALCVALVSLLGLVACESDMVGLSRSMGRTAEQADPVLEKRRTWFDPARTRVRTETTFLVQPDGLEEEHGPDLEWYPDGTPKLERAFHHGEPIGLWRAWFPSGQQRSESFHGPSAAPQPMRWWHENGQLSTEGSTLDGIRVGAWKGWYANGRVRFEGGYRAGRREGPWANWNADGTLLERGEYRDDVRVGSWELNSRETGPQ